MSQWGFWALRLAVGLLFMYHGWTKLSNMPGTIEMFGKMGFTSMTAFWAWLVSLVEFVGGLAVVAGLAMHLATALLVIDMVVALLKVHMKMPFGAAELPLALLGGSLALFFLGGGACQMWKPKGCTGSCCMTEGGCGGKCGSGEKKEGCCESKEMKK